MAMKTEMMERIKVQIGVSVLPEASSKYFPPKTPAKMIAAILEAIEVYFKAGLACQLGVEDFLLLSSFVGSLLS